jgi:glycosyltransferase involved in cell wall biosynthesis
MSIKISLDTSPLKSGHANRGIGTYTRELEKHLKKSSEVTLVSSAEAEVIHHPYFDLFFTTLSFQQPKPTIVTIHDVIPLVFSDHYPPGFKGWFNLKRQQLSLSKVKAVITDSATSKKDIHNHLSVPVDKIYVVPLAANPDLIKPSPTQLKQTAAKYQLPEKYILYVGDINYNKNIPELIRSLKYLPDDLILVLVGKNFKVQPIPEWQAIRTALLEQNLAQRVKMLTNVDSTADLAAIYSSAQAYVQPSLYEGFGLPVLEALSCQVPVVSTNNSSLTEVGGEVVNFSNSTIGIDLASAINEVLSFTPAQRKTVIKNGLKWSQSYSWDKTATITAEIYQRVVTAK